MKNSFTFYKSFYDAINCLGEKAQLKLYKSIMKLNFNCCENITELEQLCCEIESELKQNRNVFAQFLLIKPHILKSAKASFNGSLGGAKKENKNAQKNKQSINIKDKNINNKNKNINSLNLNLKNNDLYFDKKINQVFDIYKKECSNLVPLVFEERNLDRRLEIDEFLALINDDFNYIEELFKRANKQVTFYDNKINLKSLIKNHESIYQGLGASKEEIQNKTVSDKLKALEAKYRAQEQLNDTG